jgi:hypothetical protein
MSYDVKKFVKPVQETHDNSTYGFDPALFRRDRCNSEAGQSVTKMLYSKKTIGEDIASEPFSCGIWYTEAEVAKIINDLVDSHVKDSARMDYMESGSTWPIYYDGQFIASAGPFASLREAIDSELQDLRT